jgi:hypothetical protein
VQKVGLLQRGGYSRHIVDFHFSIYSKYHGKYLQGFPQSLHLPTVTGSENFCISTVEVNVANVGGPSEWNGLSQLLLVAEFKRVGGEYTVCAPVSRDYVSAFASAHRLHLGTPVDCSFNGVKSDGPAQTFTITFDNAMGMIHEDAKQGDRYVFAVTVLSAIHGTDLLYPVAYLDSPSFQLLESASPAGQVMDAVAELLEGYEIQRNARLQAEAAVVQTLLSDEANRALLASSLSRAPLHSTLKLDLVVEDLLGWVRDDTTRACCDRPWYSARGKIVQDPTAALVRNVLGSSVLEQVLTCISRHNDILEGNLAVSHDDSSAAENGAPGAEQTASRGTSDLTGSATEGDTSTTGNVGAPAEWKPIPVELPSPAHNKMYNASSLTAVLKHTSEATLHLARRLSKRRANSVSPEFAFFFALLPDVKRVHRDLVRPFLSTDMPELPALKRATSYLRASYSWSLEGPGASGISDNDIAGTVPQPSEGQTDKETATTADSLSSEHDESAGVPRAEQGGETRGPTIRAIKAEPTLWPQPRDVPPAGEQDQESLLSFDNFKAIAQDSSCASLELLSLLADRVCSGDHARAHAQRLKGLHVRRALARKAQESEAAERASVELAAKLSADRAALRIHTGRNKIDGQPADEAKRRKDVDKNGKEGKQADAKPTTADRDALRVTGKRGRDRTEVSKRSKARHAADTVEQSSSGRRMLGGTSKRKRVRGLDVTQLHDLVRLGQMLPSAEQEEDMDVVASSDEGYSSSEEASSASLRSLSQEEGSDIEEAEEV